MMGGEEGSDGITSEELNDHGPQSDAEEYGPVPPLAGAAAGGVLAAGARDRNAFPYHRLSHDEDHAERRSDDKENSGLSNQTDEADDDDSRGMMPANGEVSSVGFDPLNGFRSALPSVFSAGNNVTLEPMAATKAAVAQFIPTIRSTRPDGIGVNEKDLDVKKVLEELKQREEMSQRLIRTMQAAMMKRGININDILQPEMYMMPHMGPAGFPPMDMATAALMAGTSSMSSYLSSQAEKLQKEESKSKRSLEAEPSAIIPKDLSKDLTKTLGLDLEQVVRQVDREFQRQASDSAASRARSEGLDGLPKPSTSSSSLPTSFSSSSSHLPSAAYLNSLTSRLPSTTSSNPLTSSSLSALSSMANSSGLGPIGGSNGGSSISNSTSRGPQYSSSSLSALQRETDALKTAIIPALHMPMTPEEYRGYCQRGTVLERSQYACDDPFFKHKCRFCHKVFGSDSALQIHVRSHTGERPFKCNICGNRFSTKGNLKVHFERHKAKYPHIKMNPNPVPEHFDRLGPLVAPPLSPSTPIPSSLPLPSAMMEPHSPGMPRMLMPPGPGGPGHHGFLSPSSLGPGGFIPPFGRIPGPHPPPPPPPPPLPPTSHHHPFFGGAPRSHLSPSQPKPEPRSSPSPKVSPGNTPRSGGDKSPSRADGDFRSPSRAENDFRSPSRVEADFRSPSRAEADFRSPSRAEADFRSPSRAEADFRSPSRADGDLRETPSRGSSEKAGSVRDAGSPPPSFASRPQSIKSEPGTPAVSSVAGLGSPQVPPPLVPIIPSSSSSSSLNVSSICSSSSLMPSHPGLPSPHPMSLHGGPHLMSSHGLPGGPGSFPLPSLPPGFHGLLPRGGLPMHMGPLSSPLFPHPPPPPPPGLSPDGPLFRNSILPSRTIDPSENLEQYMEIQKSETGKLEQMVNSIDSKVREPNECAVCHRVLSCKSALQMHYRIHTGERPFRCKLCNRKFTTKGNLKTHMAVHRAKPSLRMIHACPYCNKPFNNILLLQQHIRINHPNVGHHHHPHLPPLPFHMGQFPVWPHGPKAGLPHPSMLGLPPPQALSHHRPPLSHPGLFDLTSPRDQEEPRELDLSNKRSTTSSPQEDEDRKSLDRGGEVRERHEIGDHPEEDRLDEGDDDDDLDEEAVNDEEAEEDEAMMMDEREEEESAYGYPRDGGSSGPASQGHQSAFSENGDSDRPDSNVSAAAYSTVPSGAYDAHQPLPPAPDVLGGFLNPSAAPPARGAANPSLAALEDHVKNIESSVAQSGFERFRNSMGYGPGSFLMDKSLSPAAVGAGAHSSPLSPRSQGAPSENGSEGGGDAASKFPSLTDYQVGFCFLGGGLDPLGGRGGKNTTCPTCFKTFACRSALDIHVRSHTKERPFKCDECDRAFSTRGNLKQHQLTHKPNRDPNGEDTSSSCNNSFQQAEKSDDDLDRSMPGSSAADRIPTGGEEDEEEEGGEAPMNGETSPSSQPRPPSASSFSSEHQMLPSHTASSGASLSPGGSISNSHNNSSVSSNNNNNNNNNKSSFPDSNSLGHNKVSPDSKRGSARPPTSTPLREGDAGRRPRHVCDVCNKPFSSASALQIHTRTHTGDKPFKCHICSKAFTTRGNLKVHTGTHAYNSSPSRRGRRMSIDAPFLFGNPFVNNFTPPGLPRPHLPPAAAEMLYYQNVLNGMGGPRANEIPVIQNVGGGLGHHPLNPPLFPFGPQQALYPGREPFLSGREREREREREVRSDEESHRNPADLSLTRSRRDSGNCEAEEASRKREADRRPSPPPKRLREGAASPLSPRHPPFPHLPFSSLPASRHGIEAAAAAAAAAAVAAGVLRSTGELDLSMKSSVGPIPSSQFSPQKMSPGSFPFYSPPTPNRSVPKSSTSSSSSSASSSSFSSSSSPPKSPAAAPALSSPRESSGGEREKLLTSPPKPSPAWLWPGPSCHHCGQTFASPGALEQHLQSHHLTGDPSLAAAAGSPCKAITA